MDAKLSSKRTMSAACLDTSEPAMPMAIPISAFLSAGESLTPSPVVKRQENRGNIKLLNLLRAYLVRRVKYIKGTETKVTRNNFANCLKFASPLP